MPCTVSSDRTGRRGQRQIVDILTDQHDFVVRYNGGANAGPYRRPRRPHLQPAAADRRFEAASSGHRQRRRFLPPRFLEEVANLRTAASRSRQPRRQRSRPRHLPLYHMEEELQAWLRRATIGTTEGGIGPVIRTATGRRRASARVDGIRLSAGCLSIIVPRKITGYARLVADAKQLTPTCTPPRLSRLRGRCGRTLPPRNPLPRLATGKGIFSGTGQLARRDHKTYPDITSSTVRRFSPAGPERFGRTTAEARPRRRRHQGVLDGVGRALSSTELNDDIGERIRRTGPRVRHLHRPACAAGWFDAVAGALHRGHRRSTVALMLLDVLSEVDEVHVVAMNWTATHRPFSKRLFRRRCAFQDLLVPLPGWARMSGVKRQADLPAARRHRAELPAYLTDLHCSGTGSDQTIHADDREDTAYDGRRFAYAHDHDSNRCSQRPRNSRWYARLCRHPCSDP